MDKFAEYLELEIDEVKEELKGLNDYPLPEGLEELENQYDELGGPREGFVWRWFHSLSSHFTMSSVPEDKIQEAQYYKTVYTFFTTLMDDLVESEDQIETFQEVAKVPFNHLDSDKDRENVSESHVRFAEQLWKVLRELKGQSARGEEFWEEFLFDTKQVINSISYSGLVTNNLFLANIEETREYDSYNMMLFPSVDIDLFLSKEFDKEELSDLRKMVKHAQRMARIGNWLSTWEREIGEGDYSSGVVVKALEQGIVSADQLESSRNKPEAQRDVVANIKNSEVQKELLEDWKQERRNALEKGRDIESMDPHRFIEGMETVMKYHLASKGMK